MRSFIRNLSPRGEFILVVLIAFGPITILQLLGLFQSRQGGHPSGAGITNMGLVAALICQVALFSAVLGIGTLRGWSLATFGSRISWCGAGGGILLGAVTLVTSSGVSFLMQTIHPDHAGYSVAAAGIAGPVILLFSVIDSIFEETLEAGYFIYSTARFGMWSAVLASASFRALFHWSQGVNGPVIIFTTGLIFGLVYWRWRQLLPLVIAHAMHILYAAYYWIHHAA